MTTTLRPAIRDPHRGPRRHIPHWVADPSACDEPESRTSTATVERQQLAECVVVGDVGRPLVGCGDEGIERRVCVREPLRADRGTIEVLTPLYVKTRVQAAWMSS